MMENNTELYNKYKDLIMSLANSLTPHRETQQALIQEGVIALFKFKDSFDNTKGVQFITYIWWCIRGRMQDYLKKEVKFMEKHCQVVSLDNIRKRVEYTVKTMNDGHSVDLEFPSNWPSPEEIFEEEEIKSVIMNHIENMGGFQGECMRARLLDGGSYDGPENKKLTHLTKAQRVSNYKCGLQKLKKLMEKSI